MMRRGVNSGVTSPSNNNQSINNNKRNDHDNKLEKFQKFDIQSRNILFIIMLSMCILLIWLIQSADRYNERRMSKFQPSNIHAQKRSLQKKTDTGISLMDPNLYKAVTDLKGDSTTATVMGLASGYDLKTYMGFVGGLRKSGFKGHIILGVAPDVSPEILEYFKYRQVTPKILKWVNCTYTAPEDDKADIFKKTKCSHPYSDIKIRWSRFPLQRDWLRDCKTCTGPVLVTDVRDTLFQLDPFGPGSPPVKGLQVFEEDKSQTTQHWLTKWPIDSCKHVTYEETMLCSGTTVGTREAMLKYLEIMYEEMKVWIETKECRFNINGDDQSIHNYLFYSGQLPFATAIPNRRGGIVNTIGVEGSNLRQEHADSMMKKYNIDKDHAMLKDFEGASGKRWIGKKFNIADDDGMFVEFDGKTRSRVVHQWDRFGKPLLKYMRDNGFYDDP
eukprot:CAMPEP_0119547858 /NCGR_PEP_ID=MMETSP1352-20130426/1892_1 /TAXON_ID=265584 /ORGANISM="Stauroneis constricta, Strain CCMP1120" /LENGTH=442 /DNA_ID=CAMNT_0007592919 /DNA_START=325 /DNA_END=1650 /DNA_ORIENTATION=-